jgi:phenylacetate-coenzyme A ligase PaaK-like adenylate-forming protein
MMTFEELQTLVAHCTKPAGPSLYRTLYRMDTGSPARAIRTWDEWRLLPFLTKDSMLATPLAERTFASGYDTDHLRPSSGTSGKPPLFSPRTYLRGMEYRAQYYDFKGAMLAFTVPAMPHWHEYFQTSRGHIPRVVVFDPKNARASVRLARAAGVEAISTFAYHIRPIGDLMQKEDIAKNIRFIEICGEACTHALFEYMRRVFPQATILPFYGSSEVEDSPIGVPCRPITGEEPLAVYHAKGHRLHELIEPETGALVEPEAGAEGELVVTAYPGEPSALPLVRFRTGDTVRVVESKCPRHHTWSFTVVGRVELDFIKVPGGVLRADEAERVMRLLGDRVSDRFQLHTYERETSKGSKIQVEISVEVKEGTDLSLLATDIARHLRVNPSLTYAEGVTNGRYLPLVCTPFNPPVGKIKRLVAH